MIACKTYEIGGGILDLENALDEYVKENNILESEIILHVGYGNPITFKKIYIETSKWGAIKPEGFKLNHTSLLIYGYTFLEEVPITHCEVQAKGVEEC